MVSKMVIKVPKVFQEDYKCPKNGQKGTKWSRKALKCRKRFRKRQKYGPIGFK